MRRFALSRTEHTDVRESAIHSPRMHRLLRATPLAIAIALVSCVSAPAGQQVVDSDLSFATQDQSIWSSGDAFMFDYLQFFGIDPAATTTTVNPAAVSGGTAPFSNWTVDPFFQFRTDFKLGMEVGAKINGGSIDANLDYHVALEAPDSIVQGQPFSLTGSATRQETSSFQSSPANAEAWIDGVVQASLLGYARITTGGSILVFGTHDYRMGDDGFTDGSTTNNPYRTLVNVNYKPEIIGINRNESGQLHVLGQNQGGTGSQYVNGPTTITAGNWNVSATGALNGDLVEGSDEKTLVTASLDIDQMATTAAGLPPLGAGVAHDFGPIAFDVGYELLDVKAVLELGLRQGFSVASDMMAHLHFSEDVMMDGAMVQDYTGPIDAIPEITLLSNSVTVEPEFLVSAKLHNDTDLTVTERLPITLLEGHANVSWDVAGVTGHQNNGFGPVYTANPVSNTDTIEIFSNSFDLGGFNVIPGESYVLAAGIPGDFNGDGAVNAADYTVWRDHLGEEIALTNETMTLGMVTQEDYDTWKSNFGAITGSGSNSLSLGVPEPCTAALLASIWAVACVSVRKLRAIA
jgi:hypothetical protein